MRTGLGGVLAVLTVVALWLSRASWRQAPPVA